MVSLTLRDVVFLHHLFGHLVLVFSNDALHLVGGQIVVGGSENGEHLAAVQGLVEAAAGDDLCEVAQLGVSLDGLPQSALVQHGFALATASALVVVVPGVGAGDPHPSSPCEGEEYIDDEVEELLCLYI